MNTCSICGLSEDDHEFIYLVKYDKLQWTCHYCNVNVLYPKNNKVNIDDEDKISEVVLELKNVF